MAAQLRVDGRRDLAHGSCGLFGLRGFRFLSRRAAPLDRRRHDGLRPFQTSQRAAAPSPSAPTGWHSPSPLHLRRFAANLQRSRASRGNLARQGISVGADAYAANHGHPAPRLAANREGRARPLLCLAVRYEKHGPRFLTSLQSPTSLPGATEVAQREGTALDSRRGRRRRERLSADFARRGAYARHRYDGGGEDSVL